MLLEEGVCYDQYLLWQNCISLCPASFSTLRPNLPATPGILCVPTFAFQYPIVKRTSLLGISSRSSGRSSKNHSTSAFQHYWSGIDLDYCDI